MTKFKLNKDNFNILFDGLKAVSNPGSNLDTAKKIIDVLNAKMSGSDSLIEADLKSSVTTIKDIMVAYAAGDANAKNIQKLQLATLFLTDTTLSSKFDISEVKENANTFVWTSLNKLRADTLETTKTNLQNDVIFGKLPEAERNKLAALLPLTSDATVNDGVALKKNLESSPLWESVKYFMARAVDIVMITMIVPALIKYLITDSVWTNTAFDERNTANESFTKFIKDNQNTINSISIT